MKDGVLEVRLVKAEQANRNRLKSQSTNFNQEPKIMISNSHNTPSPHLPWRSSSDWRTGSGPIGGRF